MCSSDLAVCFKYIVTAKSALASCYEPDGSDTTTLVPTRAGLAESLVAATGYEYDFALPLTVGTRVYSGDGDYHATGHFLCFDVATSAKCAGTWPKDTSVYAIVADPTLPGCVWTNNNDGQIRSFLANGTLGCYSASKTNDFSPTLPCTGGTIAQWQSFTLAEPTTGYTAAKLTVTKAGAVVTSGGKTWSSVPITGKKHSVDLSGLAVEDTGTAPTFTVTYSEPVRSVKAADFAVVVGPGVSGAPVISDSDVIGAAATWKVTLSRNGATGNHGATGDAWIRLDSVANRTAQDDLGNKVAVVTTGASYFLDTTGPTYIVAYSRPSPASTGPFTISVTSNEPLRATPRVSINQPGSGDVQEADTQIGAGTNTFTYSLFTIAAANGTTNVDGTATVSVDGTDITGNVGTTITSGATFTIDTTPPAITLAYAIANAVPNTAKIGRAHV